jgi:hypothetical protein
MSTSITAAINYKLTILDMWARKRSDRSFVRRKVELTADVREHLLRWPSAHGAHVLQALLDAFQNAGFLGFFPLAEKARGSGNSLIGRREASALHHGLDEVLKVRG